MSQKYDIEHGAFYKKEKKLYFDKCPSLMQRRPTLCNKECIFNIK